MKRTLPENVKLYKGTVVEMMQFIIHNPPVGGGCKFVTGLDTSNTLDERWEKSIEIVREENCIDWDTFTAENNISFGRAWTNQEFDGGGVVNDGPTMTFIGMQQWGERFPDNDVYFFTDDLNVAGMFDNIGYAPRPQCSQPPQ
jgi:hypothetical protein